MNRRFSLEQDFMNYSVDDMLYGYLQAISTYAKSQDKTYITKKNFAAARKNIYAICDLNAQNLKRHMEKLIENGLIVEEDITAENGAKLPSYVLTKESKLYQLLDWEILKYLVDTKSKNSIKIYIYLLNRYQWKMREGEDGYVFTIKELFTAIGYSSKSRNVELEKTVNNILYDLQETEFIKYVDYYETAITSDGKSVPTPKKKLTFIAEKMPNKSVDEPLPEGKQEKKKVSPVFVF